LSYSYSCRRGCGQSYRQPCRSRRDQGGYRQSCGRPRGSERHQGIQQETEQRTVSIVVDSNKNSCCKSDSSESVSDSNSSSLRGLTLEEHNKYIE
jgi:hypothetical protein